MRALVGVWLCLAPAAAAIAAAQEQTRVGELDRCLDAQIPATARMIDCLRAAMAGHARAQYNLGVAYYNGWGVAQDDISAAAWFERAAEQGDTEAQFTLGVMYATGQGVPRDTAKAVAWLERAGARLKLAFRDNTEPDNGTIVAAAQAGNADDGALEEGAATPMHEFGGVVGRQSTALRPRGAGEISAAEPSRALTAGERVGDGSVRDPELDDGLAVLFEEFGGRIAGGPPEGGDSGDTEVSARIHSSPALPVEELSPDGGAGDGAPDPGFLTLFEEFGGRVVEGSAAEAGIAGLSRAAEQGDANAQYRFGLAHYAGTGVPQNYAAASGWFRRAAAKGHAAAQRMIGDMYYYGRGIEKAYGEAALWYRRAAVREDAQAQLQLGRLHELGRGVERDLVLAHMWYNLAWTRGARDAGRKRRSVERGMTPQQVNRAQALAREWKPDP